MKGVGVRGRAGGGRGGNDGERGGPVSSHPPHGARSIPTAQLGEGVEIGPFAIIGPQVTVGDRCQLAAHARAGAQRAARRADVKVGDGAVLGGDPQDLKYQGRRDLGRGRRRHHHPRVLHDQPRHGGDGQDHRRRALLHHDLRARRARLPHGRRRHHRERDPDGRPRDDRGPGGAQRAQRRSTSSCASAPTRSSAAAPGSTRTCRRTPRRSGIRCSCTVSTRSACSAPGSRGETVAALKRAYRLFFNSDLNLSQALERARSELPAVPEVEQFLAFIEASRARRAGVTRRRFRSA